MHEMLNPGLGGRLGDRAGTFLVHRGEALMGGLVENGNQVDDGPGALYRGLDGVAVSHIGLHGIDLADIPKRLQMAGKIRAAHRDPHPVAAPGERPHHMAADEAGTAEDRHQPVAV